MDVGASKVVAKNLLKGFFDVCDALFSQSFGDVEDMFSESDLREATPGAIDEMLGQFSFSMRGRMKRGGALAMLLTPESAAQFGALAMGAEPDPSAELDLDTLREVASSCLGGGVSSLMDAFGLGPEQLTDLEVSNDPGAGSAIEEFLEADAVMASFTFSSSPAIEGKGVLLFSQAVEAMVPPEMKADTSGDLASDAQLSEAEMGDILSGFTPEGSGETVVAETKVLSPDHENIDRVLDIQLVATARLGHVEMPVGEVLSLGPGSIVEVGHLVDEPIELLVNNKLIARGDVVVIDEKFGLRITEILSPEERIESLH